MVAFVKVHVLKQVGDDKAQGGHFNHSRRSSFSSHDGDQRNRCDPLHDDMTKKRNDRAKRQVNALKGKLVSIEHIALLLMDYVQWRLFFMQWKFRRLPLTVSGSSQ